MADIEKVIKCLELCRKLTNSCEGCPYENVPAVENCMLTMHGDALELLKEQEAVEPKKTAYQRVDHTIAYWYRCGTCDISIFPSYKYCPFCGQAVKWDE